MESDTEEGVPELTKMETKIIQDVITELSEDPYYITSGDQLFTLFTRFQVQPEKQLKMMFAVAFELSELSENCAGEMSDQYLRLSTLATVAVQEKFGHSQERGGGRKSRTAKNNAKINMSSYFDTVEPTLFNESSDEDSAKKKRKKADKVEWSDSELKETEPAPKSPKTVESVDSENEGSDADQPQRASSSQKEAFVRQSQRKKGPGVDVICIDSSDEDDAFETSQRPQKAAPPLSKRTKVTSPKVLSRKKHGRKPRPPAISESSVTKLLASGDKSDKTDKDKADKVLDKADKTVNVLARPNNTATKPVGVVAATPRVAPDTKRSTNNTIKQDEALILNFKKGHYPKFQNTYTHLVVSQKPSNDLYTDTAPNVSEILALDGQVVPSADLGKYSLKQFVHNESGQFMLGESDGNLFTIVPGIINKNKDKT